MKSFLFFIRVFSGFVILSLIMTKSADAYLDPGTGAYFLQLLIAAVVAAGCSIKIFWTNISTSFKNFFKKKNDT